MESKGVVSSKTIWGALIALDGGTTNMFFAVISYIATFLGFDIGDSAGWATDTQSFLGAALAIYGRYKAIVPIKGVVGTK
jgi:hypothetical protein